VPFRSFFARPLRALHLTSLASFVAFAAVGCGGSAPAEEEASDSESEALVTNEEASCPANTDLNVDYRTCEGDEIAVGPFPKAMVDACLARGASYCTKAYWPKGVVHELRGDGYCPPGTAIDEALGVCVDETHAYGPFTARMTDFCRAKGGGSPCFALKWRKEWVPVPSDNDEDSTPGEIEPPLPEPDPTQNHPPDATCHRATGYRKGVPFEMCVTTIDGKLVERETARNVRRMQDAARRDHVLIHVVSGFRTMGKQRELYRLYKSGRGALAASPGYSNHQRGTAFDLNTRGRGVYAWLTKHADEYGFARTVPSEKWHWEYVAE
jgi:hypothetical protein